MAINTAFDDGWSPDRVDGPESGRYHVAISAIRENGGNRGEMIVDYEVLAGTTPGQEGRVHRDYFAVTIKAMSRIHQLAMAVGMITAEQIKTLMEANTPPSYDFEGFAVGRQIMVELTEDEYQGKKRVKCGFGIYSVNDSRVAKWPKNIAMAKAAGFEVNPGKATPPSATDDLFNGVV
jgi:hypothetical protein